MNRFFLTYTVYLMTMIKTGRGCRHIDAHIYMYLDTDSFNSSNVLVDIKDGVSSCCVKAYHATHL